MTTDTDDKPPLNKNGYKLPRRVAILYSDVKREYFPSEEAYITEKGAQKYADVIATYVQKLGTKTETIPGNSQLVNAIKKFRPDMVINLVDSFKGSDYYSSVIPAVLELFDIPYTGTDFSGISLSSNKFLVNELLEANGIPVPRSQLLQTPYDYIDPTLRYPLISKLNETHGSVEINQDSISENEKHLRERLKMLVNTYKQPVLLQEFIVGRELSAVLLEGLNKKVYIGERVFENYDGKYQLVTFDMKWKEEKTVYQKYEDPVLREFVKKACSVMGFSDYSRFDIKVDNSGRYFFLDVNANPFLGPKETDSSVGIILDMYGVDFEEALKRLLINTIHDMQGKERLPIPPNEQ